MRVLVAMLIVGLSFDAAAQAPPPPQAPTTPPPRNRPVAMAMQPTPAAPSLFPLHVAMTPDVVDAWHRARIVSVTGTLLSVVGTGLSLASVIYVAASHYPPSAADLLNPPTPSDPGPVLAYIGSTTSAAGFILSASALGYEHHLLDQLDVDPGHGRFAIGTSIGVLGFLGVGASYFFGLTNYLDAHDQEIAILTTSIGGAALCAVAGLFYALDSSRNKAAWKTLATF